MEYVSVFSDLFLLETKEHDNAEAPTDLSKYFTTELTESSEARETRILPFFSARSVCSVVINFLAVNDLYVYMQELCNKASWRYHVPLLGGSRLDSFEFAL